MSRWRLVAALGILAAAVIGGRALPLAEWTVRLVETTRSLLASSSGQMSIDDFLEMPVRPGANKGMSKAQKKVAGGQLTLF